jgi:hypothetical protein
MDLHPIKTEEDLANELFLLVERAKMGGLKSDNIEAIDSIVETINKSSEIIDLQEFAADNSQPVTSSEELRNSYRMNVNREAVAIFQEQRLHMNITDVSTTGFGLFSEEEAPQGESIHLEINGIDGMDIYSCLICYCGPKDSGYHVGLRILKKLPRL